MKKKFKMFTAFILITIMFAFAGCVTNTSEVTTENTSADIGAAKAKKIALEKVEGAAEEDIVQFEKDYDDGILEYEGEILFHGYEYEFEINGETGRIIEWEIDAEY